MEFIFSDETIPVSVKIALPALILMIMALLMLKNKRKKPLWYKKFKLTKNLDKTFYYVVKDICKNSLLLGIIPEEEGVKLQDNNWEVNKSVEYPQIRWEVRWPKEISDFNIGYVLKDKKDGPEIYKPVYKNDLPQNVKKSISRGIVHA